MLTINENNLIFSSRILPNEELHRFTENILSTGINPFQCPTYIQSHQTKVEWIWCMQNEHTCTTLSLWCDSSDFTVPTACELMCVPHNHLNLVWWLCHALIIHKYALQFYSSKNFYISISFKPAQPFLRTIPDYCKSVAIYWDQTKNIYRRKEKRNL